MRNLNHYFCTNLAFVELYLFSVCTYEKYFKEIYQFKLTIMSDNNLIQVTKIFSYLCCHKYAVKKLDHISYKDTLKCLFLHDLN